MPPRCTPCRVQSVQPGAVDFDLVFQCPAVCHDADIQHQIYEKKLNGQVTAGRVLLFLLIISHYQTCCIEFIYKF